LHPKRDGWSRDLAAKVQAKAEQLVWKAAVRSSVRAETAVPERTIVDAGADQVFQVRMSQRTDIARTTSLFRALLVELEITTGSIDMFTRLGELMDSSGIDDNGRHRRDLLNETYLKVISTVGRIESAKKVTEMLEKWRSWCAWSAEPTASRRCGQRRPAGVLAQAHRPLGPARDGEPAT
jgi:hypothetical protein